MGDGDAAGPARPAFGPGAPAEAEAGEYLPFSDRPFRLRMGVRALDLDDWLEVDGHFDDDLALKERLVAERPDEVVAAVDHPLARAAAEELWSLVAAASPRPCADPTVHPIARCALSTQEDWVVLADLGDGTPVLAAACVCFPTRWRLVEKVGLSNRAIHAPVAYYDEQLGDPVDGFLDRLSVERPVWRLNWNLVDDPALFQPVRPNPSGPDSEVTSANMGERVWLRVERQTLRRLPVTGAIAFSIRIHQRPLASLAGRPDVLRRLDGAVRALPDETFRYKGLAAIGTQLEAWIAQALR